MRRNGGGQANDIRLGFASVSKARKNCLKNPLWQLEGHQDHPDDVNRLSDPGAAQLCFFLNAHIRHRYSPGIEGPLKHGMKHDEI